MRIGIDFDDVIVDFAGALIRHYNPILGKEFSRSQNKSFHIENMWECSKEEAQKRIRAYYTYYQPEHLSIFEGAQEAISQLKQNHELVIITGRPRTVENKTRQTIEEHFPGMFEGIHFTDYGFHDDATRTKAAYCKRLKLNLFIDDHHAWVEQIANEGIETLLFDAPWNQVKISHPKITRVHSWNEISKHVEKINKKIK
jgi:uncharacterized HAD superfamily protein